MNRHAVMSTPYTTAGEILSATNMPLNNIHVPFNQSEKEGEKINNPSATPVLLLTPKEYIFLFTVTAVTSVYVFSAVPSIYNNF